MLGQGVRVLHPPKGSSGVLLFWRQGQEGHGSQEHNDDSPLAMKKVTVHNLDQLAFVYVFYYVNVAYEPTTKLKVVPSEGALDETQPMEVDSGLTPNVSKATPENDAMDIDKATVAPTSSSSGEKRRGPETRMVTIEEQAAGKSGGVPLLREGGQSDTAQPHQPLLAHASHSESSSGFSFDVASC